MNMFKDDKGNWSSMRVMQFIVVVAILGVWATVSIWAKKVQPLDFGAAGALGTIFVSKAVQKFAERDKP